MPHRVVLEARQKEINDTVQLLDFNRDAEEIEAFLSQKERQLAAAATGAARGCLSATAA